MFEVATLSSWLGVDSEAFYLFKFETVYTMRWGGGGERGAGVGLGRKRGRKTERERERERE